MSKYIICALTFYTCLLCCITSYGQRFKTLVGKVIDSKTNDVIQFASIGLKSSPLSTVTNLKGEFTFNIPENLTRDSLIVSSIGYSVKSIPIRTFKVNNPLIIKLSQNETILNGVIITDSLDGTEIMRLALERMENNHPNFPISMNAFYRERQLVDGKYVSLVEAAVTIYDENDIRKRKSPLRTKVRVDQLRRSLVYEHPYNDWWQKDNLMMHAWSLNPIPYSLPALRKELRKEGYFREQNTAIHGKNTYVIKTVNTDYWSSVFFIQAQTYAFVRVEQNYDTVIDGHKEWHIKSDSITLDVHFKQRHTSIDFKEYQGKYYPSYIKLDANHDYMHEGQKLINFRIAQDIIVNDLKTNDPQRVERHEASRFSKSLLSKDYDYNEEFWTNFNILQETPLEAKLIADLEEKISLEQQFKAHKP